uniref:Uncharacterized protein n=1 Tax=Helianthus annuus TaxID=4232 RepID=A0A251SYU8_HELAN
MILIRSYRLFINCSRILVLNLSFSLYLSIRCVRPTKVKNDFGMDNQIDVFSVH